MYKDILNSLNSILEESRKVEKDFDLESKFKKNPKKQEKELDIDKIKEIIGKLKEGKASLEELDDALKEIKEPKKDKEDKEDKEEKKPEASKKTEKKQ